MHSHRAPFPRIPEICRDLDNFQAENSREEHIGFSRQFSAILANSREISLNGGFHEDLQPSILTAKLKSRKYARTLNI